MTIVGLVTIAVSVYMIMYSQRLYGWLAPALTVFERRHPVREMSPSEESTSPSYDVIVFGLGRYGGAILQLLRSQDLQILGVDFNPAAVRRWRAEGIDTVYGDLGDPELVGSLPLKQARWVVSAIPEHDGSLADTDPRVALVQILRAEGYAGRLAIAAHGEASIERLRELEADLVLIPLRDAAERAVELLLGEQRQEGIEIIDAGDQKELAG